MVSRLQDIVLQRPSIFDRIVRSGLPPRLTAFAPFVNVSLSDVILHANVLREYLSPSFLRRKLEYYAFKNCLPEICIWLFPDLITWYTLSKFSDVSDAVMMEFTEKLFWVIILRKEKKISENVLRIAAQKKCLTEMCWFYIVVQQNLSPSFVREFASVLDLNMLLQCQSHHLSKDFLMEHQDRIDWLRLVREVPDLKDEWFLDISEWVPWEYALRCHKFSETFLSQHWPQIEDEMNWTEMWRLISIHQNISPEFIRIFQLCVNWNAISCRELTSDFIAEFEDKLNWDELSYLEDLKEELIRRHCDRVDWYAVSKRPLSENFIREFRHLLDWRRVSSNSILSENFIREHRNYVNWYKISKKQKLSLDFIEEFQHVLDWHELSRFPIPKHLIVKYQNQLDWHFVSGGNLSEDFVRKFSSRVDWYEICRRQKLSLAFIREFQDSVSWTGISTHQQLTEDFIREFKDKVNWSHISEHQKLTLDFIREFQNEVDWHFISSRPELDEDSIEEFKDRVCWVTVSHRNLSKSFIYRHKAQLDWKVLLYSAPEDVIDACFKEASKVLSGQIVLPRFNDFV